MPGPNNENSTQERDQDDRCIGLRSGRNCRVTLVLPVLVAVILVVIAFTIICAGVS